jgi:hypothetical protein
VSIVATIARRDKRWHHLRLEEPMGKWPQLDKIEMIDGPIDEDSYERHRKLQRRLLDLPSTTCGPGAG